MFQN